MIVAKIEHNHLWNEDFWSIKVFVICGFNQVRKTRTFDLQGQQLDQSDQS